MSTAVKPLPEEVKKNGLLYKLIKRGTKAAMYKVIDPETGIIQGFETMKIKITPARKCFGVDYPAFETFPGNNMFGLWAWCYSNTCKDRAEAKYNEIEAGNVVEVEADPELVEDEN